jgi:hypothetical protein
MLNHKFSEDLPIKELMNSYLEIDIEGKSLDTILNNTATIIDIESSKLQPTTAPHAYYRMKKNQLFNWRIRHFKWNESKRYRGDKKKLLGFSWCIKRYKT